MDFLIGGVPRGGTTITADFFNYHPSAFCLANESHVVSLCMRYAPDAPVQSRHMSVVRSGLIYNLNFALRFMAEKIFSAEEKALSATEAAYGYTARRLTRIVFDEHIVVRIANAIGDLMESGKFGGALIVQALASLANEVRSQLDGRLLGEKTPANVFALAKYGLLGARFAVIMKREPFAVIRSMRSFQSGNAELDNTFNLSLLQMIATYNSYAEAIALMGPREGFIVLDYEELFSNARSTVSSLFALLGVSADEPSIDAASTSIRRLSKREAITYFATNERSIIWHLTRSSRDALGYSRDFYDALDFEPRATLYDYEVGSPRLHVLTGFHSYAPDSGLYWLEEEGQIVLETQRNCKDVTLSFWVNVPRSILNSTVTPVIEVFGGIPERCIGRSHFSDCPSDVDVVVQIEGVDPVLEGKGGLIRLLRIKANFCFRPISLSKDDLPDGFDTPDYRAKSVLLRIKNWSSEGNMGQATFNAVNL